MLLLFRKELLTRVHNFIHLNLSISLLLGYVAFLSGIQTAVVNKVSLESCTYSVYSIVYIAGAVYAFHLSQTMACQS